MEEVSSKFHWIKDLVNLCKNDLYDPLKIIGSGSKRDDLESEFYDYVILQDGTCVKGSTKDYLYSESIKKIRDEHTKHREGLYSFIHKSRKLMKNPIDHLTSKGRAFYRAAYWLQQGVSDERKEQECCFGIKEIKNKAKKFIERIDE